MPAQIKGEFAGDNVEEGLQAAPSTLALDFASQDATVEDAVVLAMTMNSSHNFMLSSLHEALQRPGAAEWTEVICWEIDSLMHSNMFTEVNQVPATFTPIGSKFIFSLKRDVSGKVVWYKAQLVAQGFFQQEGTTYTNMFAPVIKLTSIQIMLAIMTNLGLELDHLDVETAFLNGKINKEIYMQAPKRF